MSGDEQGAHGGYAVPTYQLEPGDAWYHFLHGNVPGHEIDFIYRADVPQPPLMRQHFAHLTRLLRYIEPQSHESFAFAIGNLSRDDTQHEPGHGGMALVFMLRIEGATDHAGRQDPPFAHAIAAIDRELDEVTLIQTAVAFQKHILVQREAEAWYRHYVRLAGGEPEVMRGMCETYLGHFDDLPQAERSSLQLTWVTPGKQVPKRVVLVHDDEVSFGEIAVAAARIAAVLFRSDIRWTAISNGREDDIHGGVSVRLVARSHLSAADAAGVVHDLHDLPDDEEGIAHQLFGAEPASMSVPKQASGWRERFAAASGERASEIAPERPKRRSWDTPPPRVQRPPDPDSIDVTLDLPGPARAAPVPMASEPPGSNGRVAMVEIPRALPFVPAPSASPDPPLPATAPPHQAAAIPEPDAGTPGSKRVLWFILGGFCVVLLVIVAVVLNHAEAPPVARAGEGTVATSASAPAPPASAAPPAVPVTSAPVPSAPSAQPEPFSKPKSSTKQDSRPPVKKPSDSSPPSKKTNRLFDTQ